MADESKPKKEEETVQTTNRVLALQRRQLRKGLTLIESLIVLAVLAIVVVVVINAGIGARENANVSNAHQGLATLVTNIQNSALSTGDFAGLDTQAVIDGNWAPKNLVVGSSLEHPWGGRITVDVNAGNSGRFELVLEDVPQEVCTKLASQLAQSLGGSSDSVTIGSTVLPSSPTGSQIATPCAAAAQSDILFVIRAN